MRLLFLFCFVSAFGFAANTGKPSTVSFHKDVLPVLQAKCQGCHRPGEAAPFALQTYEQARPYARAMREAVLAKRMPPWFADPHVGGKFVNDWSLTESEIKTLAAWAEQGAKEGNKADAKPNPVFTNGWQIPNPDLTLEAPEPYDIPTSGTIQYTYYIIPTGLTEDKWVSMAEARPGARAQVHHIIAYVREPGSQWLPGAPLNKAFVPTKGGKGGPDGFLAGYAPGMLPMKLRPGQAMLLKAGSDIVFQMHYTTNGKPARDQSRLGIVFAKEPVKQRVHMLQVQNGRFTIPAGADDYPVAASITLGADMELLDLQPHMHARGKTALMKAVYPTGEEEKLLSIKWDFNWQLLYELPAGKLLPKGTRIEGLNTYDNTPNNKFNPDPKVDVRWGDQSWEEMMVNFFRVAVDVNVPVRSLVARPPAKPAAD
jgi:hypothetical protein